MFTDESCHPHNSLSVYVCVCAFGAMDQMTYFCFILSFFFSDLYTSVVLFIGFIESMFFCESSGKGAVYVDLSDVIFIFNFCAILVHPEA